VIPTASHLPDIGRHYCEVFRALGADSAFELPFATRADGSRPDYLERLESASAVFLTGGNQLRLSTLLGGTAAVRTLRRLNAEGVVVAGTSAGAAALCEHMIAYGSEGPTPRGGMVSLAPGFGLVNSLIIDQHFRQRDRLGRLLTALAYNPYEIGLGLDEDTAVIIENLRISVIGRNAVTVVDASALEHSGMGYARQGQPVSLIGLQLHILVDGGVYLIDQRRALPTHDDTTTVDSAQLVAADRDVDVGRDRGDYADDEDEKPDVTGDPP
jgi:cyanophycinase